MARCSRCGKQLSNPDSRTLVRGTDGRWAVCCHECAENAPELSEPSAEEASAGAPARDAAPSIVALAADHPLAPLQAALLPLFEAEEAPPPRHYTRAHERHETDLRIEYVLRRDTVTHVGQVRDISGGGLCFFGDRQLSPGHVLTARIFARDDSGAPLLERVAQVRRVRELPAGQYEVGVRFVQRSLAQEPNRRQFSRTPVDMRIYYTRSGSDLTGIGRVVDISRGGARLLLSEPLEQGETILGTMRGDGGRFAKADLIGELTCMRVTAEAGWSWTIGCRFGKLKTRARLDVLQNEESQA